MRPILPLGITVALVVTLAACAGTDSLAPTASEPVVAEIAGVPITLSEFEERYARSAGGRANAGSADVADYEDFLQRYVDFRLKVLAGKDAGLHLVPEVVTEIETYRNNFARPYLLEQEVIEPLVREVYERQQSLIRASHILIRVDETAMPADTLQAYQKLVAIADSAAAGADFAELARRHSEDPSARRPEGQPGSGGDLGYFGTGQMVEPFESYAFSTDVGALSPVFRTNFGYHVLYVEDRMPNPDPINVSHIMIDPAAHVDQDMTAEELANSLRDRARAGEDFATLVQEYSHDMSTTGRGGELGFIEYTSRIVPSFIQGAFALENVGDVSDIVETPFGLHIIRLNDRRARPSFEEAYPDLKQRVARMPRAQEAERTLARRIRADVGETQDLSPALAIVGGRTPTAALAYLVSDSLSQDERQSVVATLGQNRITVDDLAGHLRAQPRYTAGTTEARLSSALNDLLSERAIEYEARSLERTDAAFASLMREFEEGLILFRFMEDSVWTAAAQDSAAIEAIYRENPDRYRFPNRTRVVTVSATSDSLMNAFVTWFDESADFSRALDRARDAEGLRVDTTYLADRTDSAFDRALDLQPGQRTEPTRDRGRRVLMINAGIDAARTKTLDEARPEIVSAYQDRLEQEILSRLRENYRVRLYPERLVEAFRSNAADLALGSSS